MLILEINFLIAQIKFPSMQINIGIVQIKYLFIQSSFPSVILNFSRI